MTLFVTATVREPDVTRTPAEPPPEMTLSCTVTRIPAVIENSGRAEPVIAKPSTVTSEQP